MEISLSNVNWIAVIGSVVAGQALLTLWFTLLFGESWAKAYGAEDRADHTLAVPSSTYSIGLACMVVLVIGTALLHQAAGINSIGGGLVFGVIAAMAYGLATVLPGYGFLLNLEAGRIAAGSQAALILVVSVVLSAFG
ncbi:DUF1761 family protein [Ruegeria meonggei]|uniref:DUF1761 domain-containing protein n=1 Tax=Ruegeria meonggei TaxID=1446476 RepID=A0A1X7AD13_9RHOB|nr:DUF1761 family protein [Ruegeria meonggei]SLN76583.1 hypothetical protein RUM8411_04436 [Ruegeria meonggei]